MILEIATIRIKITLESPDTLMTDYLNTVMRMYKTEETDAYDFELKTTNSNHPVLTPADMEYRNGAYYTEYDDTFAFKTEEWASTIYWRDKIMTVMFVGERCLHNDVLLIRSLKLLVSLLIIEKGGVPLHCSAVAKKDNNRGLAFYGPSNAGKTTIVLFFGRTCSIYNDEFNIILPHTNNYQLYSTPFTSPEKIVFCTHGSAPLIKLFSLKKGPDNKTEPMTQKQKYLSLLESVYAFPTSEYFTNRLLLNLEEICMKIPVAMLYFNLSGTICEEIEHFL